MRRYLAHLGSAVSIAVSPDGSKVFVTGDIYVNGGPYPDFGTVAYSAATGAQLWTARHSATTGGSEAQAVAVSPNGSKVVVCRAAGLGAASRSWGTSSSRAYASRSCVGDGTFA